MKKLLVFLNSNILGGAERSIVHQVNLYDKEVVDVTVVIPVVKGESSLKLEEFVREQGIQNIKYLKIPKMFYTLSRSNVHKRFLSILISLFYIFSELKKLDIPRFNILWLNGNKIGFVLYLFAMIFKFPNKVIWHFRDYPSKSYIAKKLWNFISKKRSFSFICIGNSKSVTEEIKLVTDSSVDVLTVYNPVGESFNIKQSDTELNIGVASMLAPWKGQHQVLYFSKLYEKELKALGVNKIKIFGDDIYKTDGNHAGYKEQLLSLKKKLNCSLVEFCGIESPQVIFSESHILIHPSIEPEPFGRVIVEAFKAKVPIITTGLGGAAELVQSDVNGFVFQPYDYASLLKCIKRSIEEKSRITDAAFDQLQTIEDQVKKSLLKVIS